MLEVRPVVVSQGPGQLADLLGQPAEGGIASAGRITREVGLRMVV